MSNHPRNGVAFAVHMCVVRTPLPKPLPPLVLTLQALLTDFLGVLAHARNLDPQDTVSVNQETGELLLSGMRCDWAPKAQWVRGRVRRLTKTPIAFVLRGGRLAFFFEGKVRVWWRCVDEEERLIRECSTDSFFPSASATATNTDGGSSDGSSSSSSSEEEEVPTQLMAPTGRKKKKGGAMLQPTTTKKKAPREETTAPPQPDAQKSQQQLKQDIAAGAKARARAELKHRPLFPVVLDSGTKFLSFLGYSEGTDEIIVQPRPSVYANSGNVVAIKMPTDIDLKPLPKNFQSHRYSSDDDDGDEEDLDTSATARRRKAKQLHRDAEKLKIADAEKRRAEARKLRMDWLPDTKVCPFPARRITCLDPEENWFSATFIPGELCTRQTGNVLDDLPHTADASTSSKLDPSLAGAHGVVAASSGKVTVFAHWDANEKLSAKPSRVASAPPSHGAVGPTQIANNGSAYLDGRPMLLLRGVVGVDPSCNAKYNRPLDAHSTESFPEIAAEEAARRAELLHMNPTTSNHQLVEFEKGVKSLRRHPFLGFKSESYHQFLQCPFETIGRGDRCVRKIWERGETFHDGRCRQDIAMGVDDSRALFNSAGDGPWNYQASLSNNARGVSHVRAVPLWPRTHEVLLISGNQTPYTDPGAEGSRVEMMRVNALANRPVPYLGRGPEAVVPKEEFRNSIYHPDTTTHYLPRRILGYKNDGNITEFRSTAAEKRFQQELQKNRKKKQDDGPCRSVDQVVGPLADGTIAVIDHKRCSIWFLQ